MSRCGCVPLNRMQPSGSPGELTQVGFFGGGWFFVEAGAAGSGAGPLAGALRASAPRWAHVAARVLQGFTPCGCLACLCASLALSREQPTLAVALEIVVLSILI